MVRTSRLAARLFAIRTRTKWKKVYTDTSICNLRLSKFAEGLIPEEKNMYCAKLKELGCVDPLTIPLSVYKSGKKVKEVLPPIIDNHLVLYLVIERNGSNGEKYEAYKKKCGSRLLPLKLKPI
jgi:hypothetical protein